MKKISFKKFIPGIAWFFIVLLLLCAFPGKDLPKVDWLTNIDYYDKVVTYWCIWVLTVLFCWPFYKSSFNKQERLQYFLKIAIVASIWGLTMEFIQKFFIPGRSFDLLDWAADSLGAFIAYFLVLPKDKYSVSNKLLK